MRSSSPCWQTWVDIVIDGWTSGFGRDQARHSRHVSHTSATTLWILGGRPTESKIVFMVVGVACHHRRCSLRTSLKTTAGFCDLRSRKLCDTSNLDQSVSLSPVPVDMGFLRSLVLGSVSSVSSPSWAPGFEGAGASSSPMRCTPRGKASLLEAPLVEASFGARLEDDVDVPGISTPSLISFPSRS